MQTWMIVVAGLFVAGPTAACSVLEPFEMTRIGGADLVLVGEVLSYEDLGTSWGSALVTVAVDEVLKGEVDGEVTFIWNAGMAQGPHEGRAKGRVLIGAMRGGRIAVSDMTPDVRPDLPSIIQPYCGEVWMHPATAERVATAQEALE